MGKKQMAYFSRSPLGVPTRGGIRWATWPLRLKVAKWKRIKWAFAVLGSLNGKQSNGLHHPCGLVVCKLGGIKRASSLLPPRGPEVGGNQMGNITPTISRSQVKMIEMGCITRAVSGSPSGE